MEEPPSRRRDRSASPTSVVFYLPRIANCSLLAARARASVPAASPLRPSREGQLLQARPGDDQEGREGQLALEGRQPHNVAIKKPGATEVFKRSELKTDGKYESTSSAPLGTWRILCESHPRKMRMKVIVKSS